MGKGRRVSGQEGFTLGEVVIGMVILGVLTSIAVPAYKSFSNKAKAVEGELALNKIRELQDDHFLMTGIYSDNLAALGFTPNRRLQYYTIQIQLGVNSFQYQATATSADLDDWVLTKYPDGTTDLRRGKAP